MPTPTPTPIPTPVVHDLFGRTVNESGIVLVDWEGQIANPAMKHYIKAPEDFRYPVQVELSSTSPRLYFDLPSATGFSGPRKSITIENASSDGAFYISIFPDRDTLNETHQLTVRAVDANSVERTETIDVNVIDQDLDRPSEFEIHVDFSQDQTGLFDDQAAKETIQQVTEDWAYFFGDMDLDEVPAGQEVTWIWSPEGFTGGMAVTNQEAYTGFLLYAYGIQHDRLNAGGEGSYQGGYQSTGGKRHPIKRSGGIELEKRGNYNTLGWTIQAIAEDWWLATNLGHVTNDLYSIAHHEMGHSLAFNQAYDRWVELKTLGRLTDATVEKYQGSAPAIDNTDHLPGTLDRASRRGAFGNEYHGEMPQGRWIATKLDLLAMQAAGYVLRETSPFLPLSIANVDLLDGRVTEPYSSALQVTGGTPNYYWTVERGALPNRLALDSFTGAVSGVPTESGTFDVTVRVRDYREWHEGITHSFSLTVSR